MSFRRRAFFYLWLLSLGLFTASCAGVRPGVPIRKEKDFFPPGGASQGYYHFLIGHLHQQAGNLDRAMEAYRLALQKGEKSAFLHAQLAALHLKKGQAEKAIAEAEEAVRVNPRHLPA